MTERHVIFDIGGVLVTWKPHLAWVDALGSQAEAEAEAFMARTDFKARNLRADGGARFADLAAELADNEDRALFVQYVPQYARTVTDKIDGSWALMHRLRSASVPVHAITNWSAETWPQGLKAQPELEDAFDTLVISEREGVLKPEARIFHILCERAGVAPSNASSLMTVWAM
ncbi:HAD family hydrolase [uncultured Ruegeria sp.]|uniref:HAD family hydrolase n=1 Tax=uncultured Ruegeria sp. TaxID=259304 RepID=UPI0026383CF1|nr:HAD family hydrolase [uncultured Ruegeria sp.]